LKQTAIIFVWSILAERPVDHWRLNDRSRGIGAFGNAKLNGSKGTIVQLNDIDP